MKFGRKAISCLLVLAILISVLPMTLAVQAVDITVNNTASVIASVDGTDLNGTTTFAGNSGSFSGFNLKNVEAGVYKVAYYMTVAETTASGQLSLKPYGENVVLNVSYETLKAYPNGKVMIVAVIRANGDFTVGGSFDAGLYGTVDKIQVAKSDYDFGSDAGQYVMIQEGAADAVSGGYIQPDDSEWTASVPKGLSATYYQQSGFISRDGNYYRTIFDEVGAPGMAEECNFDNKNYFDETWDGLLNVSEKIGETTGVTNFIESGTGVTKLSNGVGNDDFLVHWSGTVTSTQTTRDYKFIGLKIDNGVCIKVNGKTVYEYWGNGCWFDDDNMELQSSISFTLNQNEATQIDIYYLELNGGEGLNFIVYDEGSNRKKTFNAAGFTFDLTATHYQAYGFSDSYDAFNNAIGAGGGAQSHTFTGNQNYDASIGTIRNLVSPVGTMRTDTFIINTNSDFTSKASAVGCTGDNGILVEYNGYITAEEDGTYQFGLTKADNGCLVEIGDTRVIEYWGKDTYWDNGGAALYMNGKSVTMKAGESLPVKVVFLELSGGEGFTLNVKKDGGNEIAFSASGMILSTMALSGVVTEEIPVLEETNDRVLFYTDFTSTNGLSIVGNPVVNTQKGIMVMESADYITIGTDVLKDAGLTTTVEFVVKPSAIVEHAAFAGIGTTADQNWIVMGMRDDGAIKYGMKTNATEIGEGGSCKTEGGMLKVGAWTTVKYVFEENTVSLYVDGVQKATWNVTGQKDLTQITGDFIFGKELKWGDPGFSGTVSEVRVTSSEKVIRVRNKANNQLVKTYTASDCEGETLVLQNAEVENYLPLAWYNASGNAITTAKLGETVYVDLMAIDYPMNAGRQIRVEEGLKNGLRFRATIKRGDFYNYFNEADADYVYSADADFTFGMVIIPADFLPDGESLTKETASALDVVGENVYTQFNADGDLEYTGVLTDIPESQYERVLLARPYITYAFNGKTVTIYAEETAFGSYQRVAQVVYAGNLDAAVRADLEGIFGVDGLQLQDADVFAENKTNAWESYTQATDIRRGISWPEDQVLPAFATPAATLDSIFIGDLTTDEQFAFTSFQGLVNKTQPRVHLLEFVNGKNNWVNEATIQFINPNTYTSANKYQLIQKYADEIDGLVLYSTNGNTDLGKHYRNLASTVAGLKNAIPVTQTVYNSMLAAGIDLPVVENLTTLNFTSEVELYNYLYDTYWPECNKRLIITLAPADDQAVFIRDIAAATKSAVVYLDCTKSEQQAVYEKFLKDMADSDGTSVALGWYSTERSGITTGTKYGIATIPANFYISSTTYGGTNHTDIQIPAVPAKDAVENKVYIAMYMSDGDNIQYVQGYMKEMWDASVLERGKVAINWTIAPSLVDIGPGILNHYYTTATEKDAFVCGPSGVGYAMPYNTFWEEGAANGTYLPTSGQYLENFTKLSGNYFEKAGLRVVTVWDNLTPEHRAAYEKNARYLYGVTVQDFPADWGGGYSNVQPGAVNNLYFERQTKCYTKEYDDLLNSISGKVDAWNGNSPLFLTYQASVWGNVKVADINRLADELYAKYGDKVEFVRADHYFALYNEANGLDYNLCMDDSTTVTTSDDGDTASLRDGSTYTLWTSATRKDGQYVQFDLGQTHSVSRYVIRFAGAKNMDTGYNIRAYHVEVSNDGSTWTTVDTYKENIASVVDVELETTDARYVRIVIDDAAGDGLARIADVEIYGK